MLQGIHIATGEGESDLVTRLRQGDARAWETVVRTNGGVMLATARRMLRSEEDARCVVQSAFVKALTSIARFRGDSLLSTWLHRITINEALMRLRSSARHPETPIESLQPQFREDGRHAHPVKPWPDAERLVLQEETRARVRACIEQLPTDYRVALLLRDIEELDTPKVAELLAITPNAVRIRVHRARMALRTLLAAGEVPPARRAGATVARSAV